MAALHKEVLTECDTDEYGTVVMSENTVNCIVETLLKKEPILIAFKSDEYTQYDLYFSIVSKVCGPVQRGAGAGDLMVAAMGWGAFCFNVSDAPVSREYVEEKLRFIRSEAATADTKAVADLISRVRQKLIGEVA